MLSGLQNVPSYSPIFFGASDEDEGLSFPKPEGCFSCVDRFASILLLLFVINAGILQIKSIVLGSPFSVASALHGLNLHWFYSQGSTTSTRVPSAG